MARMIVYRGTMFSIRYDDRRHLVTSVRSGFFDLQEAQRFRLAMQHALNQGECGPEPFDMLIDNSAGQPLCSEVSRYFEQIAADIRGSSARRIAFVSPGAVNRIQARRIVQAVTDPRISIFEDAAAAEAWLTQP